jgi:methylase of polypeptide subunit release factors
LRKDDFRVLAPYRSAVILLRMAVGDIRTHEVTFCSRVSKWADKLFSQNPAWNFVRTEIEESVKRKRSDLRIYASNNRLALAGEVKLPGTAEGRNAYNSDLISDAFQKASNLGAEFFFTWNVNKLVLFDSKKWNVPIMERRLNDWDLGLDLDKPEDVSRPEVEEAIQRFLAKFFAQFHEIVEGIKTDWAKPPDQYFISALESHIGWPVKLTREFLTEESASDKTFDIRLQEWMSSDQGWQVIRNDQNVWRTLIDRAARTLCYVFSNRLLFYESVRRKFTNLREIQVPKNISAPGDLDGYFRKAFQKAVDETGDYETLFYPGEKDWAGPLIFAHKFAADAWRSVLGELHQFNFKEIRTDILGGIFQRLIAPEERHKFGQHYTNEDLVDVVNAFCIRKGEDIVFDPACGSGSFLVRAYHRKAYLNPSAAHQDRIGEIYGSDISLFAAHLATLNLASRDINEEENYPRIARRNFFEIRTDKQFWQLPRGLRGEKTIEPIFLPKLNAVVGNPPYVRQELIPRRSDKPKPKPMQAKEDLFDLCEELWGVKLTGRSDLHCYFWPASTAFLKDNGWFGFLVSSSWLDVEYGFALQEWVLTHFKIHAILESNAEPWFEDARVKTCAVIMQRCDDPKERNEQLVKFVRLDAPLAEILGERADENSRQAAAEKFRDIISRCKQDVAREHFRIVVVPQKKLWEDGLRAGKLFALQKQRDLAEGVVNQNSDDEDEENGKIYDENGNGIFHDEGGIGYGPKYGGGKWGKYLRAPNLYFQIMERYANRFVPLGEIATVRFGVKSGCDAFFMPRDVSREFLDKYPKLEWNDAPLHTHCKRGEVESGEVKLVEAGDGTVHPIESEYLKPELHSMMSIYKPMIQANEVESLVLMVNKSKPALHGSYVLKYLRYGEKNPVTVNKKTNALTVPERATCANRDPWYDLTYTRPGHLVWAKGQQYRHVVVFNQNNLAANCRLYDVTLVDAKLGEPEILAAIANSTLVAFFKSFYGRYTGTEGSFEMMVIDLNFLELPDPRDAPDAVAKKLRDAFARLCERKAGSMLEEAFSERLSSGRIKKLAENPVGLPNELKMADRRDLDLAVFELLGVKDAREREKLVDELYYETTNHFRQIRIVEVQKQEQRAKSDGREFRTDELATDLWDSLHEEDKLSLAAWLTKQVAHGVPVSIPEGEARLPDASDFLEASTVFFRLPGADKSPFKPLQLQSRPHAELVHFASQHGIHGNFALPKTQNAARELFTNATARFKKLTGKADELARSRTSDERKAIDLSRLLLHWMIHGKPGASMR